MVVLLYQLVKMGNFSRLLLLLFIVIVVFGHTRTHTIGPHYTVATIAETDIQAEQINPVLPRWEALELADAKVFEDARCKGERFLAAMKGSDVEAGKLLAPQVNPPSMRSVWQGDLECKSSIVYLWSN